MIPVYLALVIRNIDYGWSVLFIYQTLIYIAANLLAVYRKKIGLNAKIYIAATLFNIVGLLGLVNFGFSGGHFWVIVGIMIVAILVQTRYSYIYILATLAIYLTLSVLLSLKVFSPRLEIGGGSHYVLHWMLQYVSIICISIVFGIGLNNYYRHLTKTIVNKIKAEKDLINMNENLELKVQERTEELATINEELLTTNEEISEKNETISNQNIELNNTLKKLKDTQTQLLQSEKMASLGVLSAGVAHEINNPLNFISGSSFALKKYLNKNKIDTKDNEINILLNGLDQGIKRCTNIISSLNEFSRDAKHKDEACDMINIINNCLTMLNHQIPEKLTIERKYENKDALIAKGNSGQLHQVFINILKNAIQSIKDKGTISISAEKIVDNVLLIIKDNGIGISEENLKRITDPFFTTKDPGEGTGLGLAITYNIIKEHDGTIDFKSEPGKGTTVKILLPLYLNTKI